ncbi:hypothetical protein P7K49_012132 [Saguinus oedipus]|uniref:Collagen alpha-1(I) chain-like n=1 Tax=Saguinus oedipus TaxID=9490 RepID=A0ABQ9VSM9_SAGOE|nr:hypothetical protein P7K49_012132 [Saguinus oedipus]
MAPSRLQTRQGARSLPPVSEEARTLRPTCPLLQEALAPLLSGPRLEALFPGGSAPAPEGERSRAGRTNGTAQGQGAERLGPLAGPQGCSGWGDVGRGPSPSRPTLGLGARPPRAPSPSGGVPPIPPGAEKPRPSPSPPPTRRPFQLPRGGGGGAGLAAVNGAAGAARPRCPPRSRAGSASGGRGGACGLGRKGDASAKKRASAAPSPLRRARAAAAAAHLTRGHPGRRGPRKYAQARPPPLIGAGRSQRTQTLRCPRTAGREAPAAEADGTRPRAPRRRTTRAFSARLGGRERRRASKSRRHPAARAPPARHPPPPPPQGRPLSAGVRVLLLLGLLHCAGDGEARKTWRRQGQQPPPPPPLPPPPPRTEAAPAAGQPVESFPLDFTAVEGNMDSFMAQVKSLAQSLYPCSAPQLNEDLRLHLLLNTSARTLHLPTPPHKAPTVRLPTQPGKVRTLRLPAPPGASLPRRVSPAPCASPPHRRFATPPGKPGTLRLPTQPDAPCLRLDPPCGLRPFSPRAGGGEGLPSGDRRCWPWGGLASVTFGVKSRAARKGWSPASLGTAPSATGPSRFARVLRSLGEEMQPESDTGERGESYCPLPHSPERPRAQQAEDGRETRAWGRRRPRPPHLLERPAPPPCALLPCGRVARFERRCAPREDSRPDAGAEVTAGPAPGGPWGFSTDRSPRGPFPAPRAPPPGTAAVRCAPRGPGRGRPRATVAWPLRRGWARGKRGGSAARADRSVSSLQLLSEGIQGQQAVRIRGPRRGEGCGGVPASRGLSAVAVSAGGWYCFNRENCDSRYDTMRRLMSSRDWPRTRRGGLHPRSRRKPCLLPEPQRGPHPAHRTQPPGRPSLSPFGVHSTLAFNRRLQSRVQSQT